MKRDPKIDPETVTMPVPESAQSSSARPPQPPATTPRPEDRDDRTPLRTPTKR